MINYLIVGNFDSSIFEIASSKYASLGALRSAAQMVPYEVSIGFILIVRLVGPKDHQRFLSSYATILKVRMTALKKRERKDRRKAADSDKRQDSKKQSSVAKTS
ncbi:NADH:ubiquinone reductase (H(+)-translocating) [Handroanthus impetiginosus]|uniref:NADH:ubiquinone reductase (H(+)-translocating) n=1 Tax=Handroanthus impetiginosus TaxID=429701 RepID=A0A2G9HMH8_9LAMI|nr:NADH:ubiquinone reductase (H(+)-translocating) [Handroanthus impetiginosus]